MRYFLIAALVVGSFAVAGFAQQSGTLSYSLSNPPTSFTHTSFDASIGGVKGTITTTSWGNWKMTVDGRTFASGTYSCGGGSCSFAGTTLAGRNLSFSMTGTSGTVPGVFTTHGAWVSTVAGWANSRLSGRNIGEVVSQAAGGKGHDPSHDPSHDLSHDPSHGSAQSASSSGRGAGPGNSDDHGGSADHGSSGDHASNGDHGGGGGHGDGAGHNK